MSELMMPEHVNLYGNVHGGTILQMADRVAYVAACRHAGPPCVTVAVDSVSFLAPILVGDVVTMHASVNHAGTTSMEVGIKVLAENLETREVRHTNSCYFVFVALDLAGKPRIVPKLILETDDEERRNRDAELRRELRMRHQEEAEKIRN
jgi:acyl-CoA hydrolase